uniref:CSON000692 protein n=1 Tax=Culicoides sonorensis TaxID=179676 RepID=A0A336LQE0_CULSO
MFILTDMAENEFSMENFSLFNDNIIHGPNESQFVDDSPVRDSLGIVIPITIIYCLIFVTGVVGNICTCIVISKNKSMHTATNYYLFSLAISDFVLLVSSVPVEMFIIWYKHPYVFGETFCILRGVAAEASANATVLTILVFTIERYVAICHPFLSHTLSKLSRAVKLIIIVWIVSFAYAIPQALQFGVVKIMNVERCVVTRVIIQHSFELSTFLFFFAPMTLITVLYILIGLKLRASTRMKRENGSMQKRIHSTTQSTRRVIKMLVCVVVAFFFCWAPFHAQRLIYIYGTNTNYMALDPMMLKLYTVMTYISGVLYYLSTCINPLLYNIMSRKFRGAFKETLQKIFGISPKNDCPKRTYTMLTRSQREYFYGASSSKQNSSEYSAFNRQEKKMDNHNIESRNSAIHVNLQKILDDNLLYSNQNQKKVIRHPNRSHSTLDFSDNNLYSSHNESELDAYMRELKSRSDLQ